jgi:hypothetical protein
MTSITQQPIAKYFIADTFKITDRGLVFLGKITEGEISPDDILEFTAFGTLLYRRIIGVEGARSQSGETNVGILITYESDAEIDKLRNAKPNNQVALTFKFETPEMKVPAKMISTPKMKRTWWQRVLNPNKY